MEKIRADHLFGLVSDGLVSDQIEQEKLNHFKTQTELNQ